MTAAGTPWSIIEETARCAAACGAGGSARDGSVVVGRMRFELTVFAMSRQRPDQLDYRPCGASAGGRY